MALTQRLDLRQTQSLVMTPQLQQAIKLLQLSNLDLMAYVENELEQNPLLRREGSDDGEDGEADGENRDAGADADAEPASMNGEATASEALDFAADDGSIRPKEAPLDTDYDNMWNGEGTVGAAGVAATSGRTAGFSDNSNILEQTVSGQTSLRDHILAQIEADFADSEERLIGAHLLGMLDEAGYLAGDVAEAARVLGCEVERIERTLERLQGLDPAGVFARNLSECLALQLRERDRLDPAMQALLDNLDLLAKHDRSALKKVCGVDDEDLAEMVAEVRALDPKPATAFDSVIAQPITPDVILRREQDGWNLELNPDTLPRVLMDNRYYARVSDRALSRKDRAYLIDQVQSANWLVKSLHQRATTILRVAREIVRQQEDFLNHGVRHLRPLILRDIAEAVEMHESTVSRVTSNKYIMTPRGIYELKYFFSAAISSADGGDAHSAESVRHRIKALIDAEGAESVLSDDAIAEKLRRDGIDIARRTVAKYREALRIPSSAQRRRLKGDLI